MKDRDRSARVRVPFAHDAGASMVETAILLPLILIAIFIAIGLAVVANGRSALSSGMTEGLRLAATRGDNSLMGGEDIIAPVRSYISSLDLSELKLLISSGQIEEADYALFLNRCFGSIHDTTSLKTLPAQYIYTLIYINQALRQSIGPSLRFPCVPPGGSPPPGGGDCPTARDAGCVSCYLINPTSLDFTPSDTADPNTYAIRCEYSPSNIFLDPIFRLFALFSPGSSSTGGRFIIKRDRLFEITRLGER